MRPNARPRTRRAALVAVGFFLALPGCTGTGGPAATRSETTTPESQTPPAPAPSSEIPRVESYPFEFEGVVAFEEPGLIGWFFDGSFTKAVRLDGTVTGGGPVSLFVTEADVREPRVPDSTVLTRREVESFDETVEMTDGNGSVLFEVEAVTDLDLRVEVTTI